MHAFNLSTWEARGRQISEFEASLVYRMSSRTAGATQRNPVSKNKRETETERQRRDRDRDRDRDTETQRETETETETETDTGRQNLQIGDHVRFSSLVVNMGFSLASCHLRAVS